MTGILNNDDLIDFLKKMMFVSLEKLDEIQKAKDIDTIKILIEELQIINNVIDSVNAYIDFIE